ncbi:MAG: hypothetical protein HQK57_09035 [Deltaproteobacteria bacterium]|nr:hypothetical protein [Deltaproteobacteria bacterium]MBF0527017.1 hypothetical protein [Deltaproteobacteria bacterium]
MPAPEIVSLARKTVGTDYLVQPLLVNHPRLDDFGRGKLVTLRIITMLEKPGGRPIPPYRCSNSVV